MVFVECCLSEAGFKALVEAPWPAPTCLNADLVHHRRVLFGGRHMLGAAAFAAFPALEELDLVYVRLGEAGLALLASRRWRLRRLSLCLSVYRAGAAGVAALARGAWPALERLELRENDLTDASVAALARGAWPALKHLDLHSNCIRTLPTLEEARRRARGWPTLSKLESSDSGRWSLAAAARPRPAGPRPARPRCARARARRAARAVADGQAARL